jgi:hypothetical protein
MNVLPDAEIKQMVNKELPLGPNGSAQKVSLSR